MNTRSRQRKQNRQDSELQTLNGSITALPDSPTKSISPDSQPDGPKNTRSNANFTPTKKRRGIYRVPIQTWNFFVRKWEIPRKTLHVSIGKCQLVFFRVFCLTCACV